MSHVDIKSAQRAPGMKEDELIELGPCAICGKPQLAHRDITFYVIEIKRGMFAGDAIQRRVGLGQMMGSQVLGGIMGPNEDLAKIFAGPVKVFVAETCALKAGHPLELMEAAEKRQSEQVKGAEG